MCYYLNMRGEQTMADKDIKRARLTLLRTCTPMVRKQMLAERRLTRSPGTLPKVKLYGFSYKSTPMDFEEQRLVRHTA